MDHTRLVAPSKLWSKPMPMASSSRVHSPQDRSLISRLSTVWRSATNFRSFPEVGALISYGYQGSAVYQHMALLVQKVLQGNKPADMPVEQPTKFELVINLKTAKALGIEVPLFFQQRADEVIE